MNMQTNGVRDPVLGRLEHDLPVESWLGQQKGEKR